jgi:hypothetical protein
MQDGNNEGRTIAMRKKTQIQVGRKTVTMDWRITAEDLKVGKGEGIV